ncbi:hypothetical protein AOLI_G00308980 [Acnodon oligacanthus]
MLMKDLYLQRFIMFLTCATYCCLNDLQLYSNIMQCNTHIVQRLHLPEAYCLYTAVQWIKKIKKNHCLKYFYDWSIFFYQKSEKNKILWYFTEYQDVILLPYCPPRVQ